MQPVREDLHPAPFPGVALPEDTRPGPPVRPWGAQEQGVRVRGVRPHLRRLPEPLHPPEEPTPKQPCPPQFKRLKTLQVPEKIILLMYCSRVEINLLLIK